MYVVMNTLLVASSSGSFAQYIKGLRDTILYPRELKTCINCIEMTPPQKGYKLSVTFSPDMTLETSPKFNVATGTQIRL